MILSDSKDGVALAVLVQARASRNKVGPIHDGYVKVAVTAPPVDGAANDAVCELIAKRLGLSRSSVELIAGHRSKYKTLRVRGFTALALAQKLDEVFG